MKQSAVGRRLNKRKLLVGMAKVTRRSINLSNIGSVLALDRKITTQRGLRRSAGCRLNDLLDERRRVEIDVDGSERIRSLMAGLEPEIDRMEGYLRQIRSEIETIESEVAEKVQTAATT